MASSLFQFDAPVKQPDSSYVVPFISNIEVGHFTWEKTELVRDLKLQPVIQGIRENVLKSLVSNKALFRAAPSLDSLRAIAPVWGMLIRPENKVEWSKQDIFNAKDSSDLVGKQAIVSVVLKGVHISQQSILPIWGLRLIRLIPEDGLIDLDFAGSSNSKTKAHRSGILADDAVSVDSEELEGALDSAKMHLRNPEERKRKHKETARSLLRKAAQAQMDADAAVERFYADFDLSDDESAVSDFDGSSSEQDN